ncbi:hypothetical protein GQ43DRAFT_440240 [Delitschia confertaspora ATCC 74209]|uniref:ZZ-type domain-containing protein n=1 Tax=Delitschia confertaspora ATCC 74209 TaxID=1513339 RepID=A0A9P4JRB0_9PLEO|nr:hypothetical protein GQ43DRAFT_440240 [Delitschia confertaspora ATCC 74209]
MATTAPTNEPVTLETLITFKVLFQGQIKKFKIPLGDLGANVLPDKLRALLCIQPDQEVIFERYSDSAGAYITLDPWKISVYKTLFRAAKAKLKLRLRATLVEEKHVSPTGPTIVGERAAQGVRTGNRSTLPPPAYPAIVRSPTLEMEPSSPYEKAKLEATPKLASLAETVPKSNDEVPVPQPFVIREGISVHNTNLSFRLKENTSSSSSWVVFCNNCNEPMENEHFHCGICDGGDYDLCPTCVDARVHCPGYGHWMVKRFVKNGIVVNSTTERIGPKVKLEAEKEMPGAFTEERKPVEYEREEPTRTCNCCIKVATENEFVTCTVCDDYDLCRACLTTNKHGHHPGHAFKGATPETSLSDLAHFLCSSGRNVRHSAVCDGCENFIYGVRHKCLNCPDWDLCSECIKTAKRTHPRHRFVPIYEPIAEPNSSPPRHYGIYCDGPLCKDKGTVSYIEGIRYKCAICHDTDFCANCEAHPSSRHNRTHPLVKFTSPVRSVSVTTMGEDRNGVPSTRLGDQPTRKSTSTETIPVAVSANAATQVQTVVDLKPSEASQPKPNTEKIQIKDLLSEPAPEKTTVQSSSIPPAQVAGWQPAWMDSNVTPENGLQAHFVRDTIIDGTEVSSDAQFVQVWTVRNPGPNPWPAGCSVRYTGGDNMLNIDNSQPLSQSQLAEASESNVIGRIVESGEEISFRVVMKAPKREGTAISYWRLKTADGVPFGHRLWCDIKVTTPPSPSTISATPQAACRAADESLDQSNHRARPEINRLLEYAAKAQKLLQEESGPSHARVKEQLESGRAKVLRTLEARKKVLERIESQRASGPSEEDRKMFQQEIDRLRQITSRLSLALPTPSEVCAKEQPVGEEATKGELAEERAPPESPKESLKEEKIQGQPVKEDIVEEQSLKDDAVQKEPTALEPVEQLQPQSSRMVFPQLEKESPVSSTIVEPDHQGAQPPAETVISPSDNNDSDFFEDAESVEIMDASSEEDNFLTDDEYDILDASDEDMP